MAHLVLRMLAITAAGTAAVAHAQLLPTPADTPAYDPPGEIMTAPATEVVPAPAAESDLVPYEPLSPIPASQDDELLLSGNYPAVTESSGTWMRRGLWYADIDAVVMARTWNSVGVAMFEEYELINSRVLTSVNTVDIPTLLRAQNQTLSEGSPGYQAAARIALGRFLFRDQSNRDHTAEMVVFGGPEWKETLAADAQHLLPDVNIGDRVLITDIPPGVVRTILNGDGTATIVGDERGLHVPGQIDGSQVANVDASQSFASFDRASAMQMEYASRFHSWEWNYNVAQRMRKDRMEMQPNGEWVRRAAPGITWDYTAGLRYFDVEERLDWFAQDIVSIDPTDGDTDGSYLARTSNNLFGLQLGAGLTYESDRWNVTVSTKQGFAINDARATTALTFVDPDEDTSIALNNYTTDLHENGVSYIGTGSILARYYLRPNFSLRAGWEFMYVTGLALAPNQVNFNPAAAQLHVTGDSFYHGISFGTEYYW